MIKRLALLIVLCAALAATSAARSQQPSERSERPNPKAASEDSVKVELSPELKRSLQDLAAAVEALMNRIASDPKIRADAIHVASGVVTTAQQVVTEQSAVLEQALKNAADKIAAAQPPLTSDPGKPR